MVTLQSLPSETSEEASPLEEASEEATGEVAEEETYWDAVYEKWRNGNQLG